MNRSETNPIAALLRDGNAAPMCSRGVGTTFLMLLLWLLSLMSACDRPKPATGKQAQEPAHKGGPHESGEKYRGGSYREVTTTATDAKSNVAKKPSVTTRETLRAIPPELHSLVAEQEQPGIFSLHKLWTGSVTNVYERTAQGFASFGSQMTYSYDLLGGPGTLIGQPDRSCWIGLKSVGGVIAPTFYRDRLPAEQEIKACTNRENLVTLLGPPQVVGPNRRWFFFCVTDDQIQLLHVSEGMFGMTVGKGVAVPSDGPYNGLR